MAITEIPKRAVLKCDMCGNSADMMPSSLLPYNWGEFAHNMVGFDTAGHAVGGHKAKYHACPGCSEIIIDKFRANGR